MTKDEALKLALQALEANKYELDSPFGSPDSGERKVQELKEKAITAIKEALAKPEQEPFGYFRYDLCLAAWVQNQGGIPFYTSPQQRNPLTDEEIDRRLCPTKNEHQHDDRFWDGVEWAKAQLKENT